VAEQHPQPVESGTELASAERIKAFTDAVVAIAMTLLILPLMESVGEAAREAETASEWFTANQGELLIFTLSFVLIAAFWMSHHQLFERIHRVSGPLLILNIAWMFTIVWLPVATATFGLVPNDVVQKALYIGALFTTSVIMAGIGVYTLRHPELHSIPLPRLYRDILAESIAAVMFAIAFVVAVAFPGIGYWSMVLLVLIGPLHAVLQRFLVRARPAQD
jgi:uncharacterized membrane protein